jgi:Spy/CpxP family protein refolding chaperone
VDAQPLSHHNWGMAQKRKAHPAQEDDLKRIRTAYRAAWAEAKRHGDEAMKALRNADLARTAAARRTFEKQAKMAIKAADNWRHAAEKLAGIL